MHVYAGLLYHTPIQWGPVSLLYNSLAAGPYLELCFHSQFPRSYMALSSIPKQLGNILPSCLFGLQRRVAGRRYPRAASILTQRSCVISQARLLRFHLYVRDLEAILNPRIGTRKW